jgi:hypothetical protein
MKIKAVFFLFNLVIVASFLFVFLLPLFVLGWSYTRVFWTANWYLAALFLLIAGGLNLYFALNWKLFALLEKEDWASLKLYLEDVIYNKKRYSRYTVRLLINTCVVQAKPEDIVRLEHHIRSEKPRYLYMCALEFGLPYLLRNDSDAMVRYYGEILEHPGHSQPEWIQWSYGFSLLLSEDTDQAKDVLSDLEKTCKNPIIRGLTLYLLDAFSAGDDDIKQRVENGRSALQKNWTIETWQKELNKQRDNLQILVLSKLMKEATGWIFPGEQGTDNAQ